MIILNKMYSGKYLEHNIGHEFINEYVTDNDEQYIYVNPWQLIKLDNSNGNDHYTIQVRYAGQECYEVLSYAKIEASSVNNISENGKDLRYANWTLEKLLGKNSTNGGIYAHFKASEFKRCKPNTYLRFSKYILPPKEAKEIITLPDFEFGKQNSRRYVPNKNDKPGDYEILKNFIDNTEYWLNKGNSCLSSNNYELKYSIIDVIGKQYEELTFSNWLSFYLQNSQLCKKFISECLLKGSNKIDMNLLNNLSQPQREFHNIDIWLESENAFIVIENKIDSGINGLKQTEDGKFNQLDKYWNFAKNEQEKRQKKEEDVLCFIIKPNYNQLHINKERWHVIEYKMIYEFFDKISKEDQFKNLLYIQEFVKALEPLTQSRKKDYKEIIENRLMKRIAELKAEKQ